MVAEPVAPFRWAAKIKDVDNPPLHFALYIPGTYKRLPAVGPVDDEPFDPELGVTTSHDGGCW